MQTNPALLGLHILLTLKTTLQDKLIDKQSFSNFINTLIEENNLMKVGESSHVFDNSSFTTAICLMESHICIHTWPEINQLTTDVYLCNYTQDNTERVRKICDTIIAYFEGEVVKKIEVYR